MDLTLKPTRLIRRAAVFPTPAPEPLDDPRHADEGPRPLASRRGIVEIPDSVFETDGPWPSVAITDLAMCMSCVYEDRGGCVPQVLPPAVKRNTATPLPGPKPLVAAPLVSTPPETEKKAPTRAAAAVRENPSPFFSVQVRAYRESAKAKEFVDALVLKGYKPYVANYTDAGGQRWFRVRIGRFKSASGAQKFAARFNINESAEAIPVALESK